MVQLYHAYHKFKRIITLKDRPAAYYFQIDQIDPNKNLLIYKGSSLRSWSFWSIICSLILIGLLLKQFVEKNWFPKKKSDPYDKLDNFAKTYGIWACIGILTVIILYCKRFIVRMYINETDKTFTLTWRKWYWPFRNDKLVCAPNQVQHSPHSLDFATGNTLIRGRRFILFPNDFRYPLYYNILHGYDSFDKLKVLKPDEKAFF